jgi:hypothetical protein
LANKKQKFAHKDLIQEDITDERNLHEAMTADINNIVKRAKAVGINPSTIINDIATAVRNVQHSQEGVITDTDVKQKKKALIEKVQEMLQKYGIEGIVIGIYYEDPFGIAPSTKRTLELKPYGKLYEHYPGGHFHDVELDSYWLENMYHPKSILLNLMAALVLVTEKNKAQIHEIESAFDFGDKD